MKSANKQNQLTPKLAGKRSRRQAVVGRIRPGVEITETPAFTGPSKCLFVEDDHGTLHGSIQWLSFEVDDVFLREFAEFAKNAMREARTA